VRRAVFDALTLEQTRQMAEINEAILQALTRMDDQTDYPADLPWRRR
jgi:hypothetical protein